MKKFLALLLVLTMVVSMAACGGNKAGTDDAVTYTYHGSTESLGKIGRASCRERVSSVV